MANLVDGWICSWQMSGRGVRMNLRALVDAGVPGIWLLYEGYRWTREDNRRFGFPEGKAPRFGSLYVGIGAHDFFLSRYPTLAQVREMCARLGLRRLEQSTEDRANLVHRWESPLQPKVPPVIPLDHLG